jgi:hypothetical protein
MFKITQTILGAVALLFLVFGPYVLFDKPFQIKYNCDLVEFSPDIPIAVKQHCRKSVQ